MKIWVDDIREKPDGYDCRCRSVEETIITIRAYEDDTEDYGGKIELIDLDHDAGDWASFGGDYINILNWLEETGRNYPIRIHSMNPVGVENMRRIIQKNRWTEVV